MSAIERELLDKISQLDVEQQRQVLEFVQKLEHPTQQYSPLDLMAMPSEERKKIMEEQFERASHENFEIFEAYSEENVDDLH